MALCNITGTVYMPNGEPAAVRWVQFVMDVGERVEANYLGAVSPDPVRVRTGKNGNIDVSLITGNYWGVVESRGKTREYRFKAAVPNAATADFADIIEAADPVEPLPAWLQQAWDARDEAKAAEVAAEDAADRAEIAAENFEFASIPEAQEGINTTHSMNPLRTREGIDARVAVARVSSFAGADPYARLSAAIAWMISTNGRIQVDEEVIISTAIEINGSGADIETVGQGRIYGIGSGRAVVSVKNTPIGAGNFTATGHANFPAPSGMINSYVDVGTPSAISADDVLYLKGTVPNSYGQSSACLAEIATVVAVSGNRVYLDCRLFNPLTTGTVQILPRHSVRIVGNIGGLAKAGNVRTSAVYVEGHVDPVVDVTVNQQASSGLMLMSCLRPNAVVVANNLDNKPSENRLGYGVVAYGATRDHAVTVFASDLRHAYTDGVYSSTGLESGNVLNGVVSGVCVSPTAAAWDTHPDSSGVVFRNIQAWSAHNNDMQPSTGLLYAVQLRGANATIDGLVTDLDKAVLVKESRFYDSVNRFYNIQQRNRIVGALSNTNRLLGVSYEEGEASPNGKAQAGSRKCIFRNCDLGTIAYFTEAVNYDEYYNCSFDFSQSTASWPTSPVAGGVHYFKDCNITAGANLNVSANDNYTLEGCSVYSASGAVFNLVDGSGLTAINSGIIVPSGNAVVNGFCRAAHSSGEAIFNYSNVWIRDGRAEWTLQPYVDQTTGTGTLTTKDMSANRERHGLDARGDADSTIAVGTNSQFQRFGNTLTANRTVTLSSLRAKVGDSFTFTRVGGGAFALSIGGLKSLSQNEWCQVVYDGTQWRLMAYGAL